MISKVIANVFCQNNLDMTTDDNAKGTPVKSVPLSAAASVEKTPPKVNQLGTRDIQNCVSSTAEKAIVLWLFPLWTEWLCW